MNFITRYSLVDLLFSFILLTFLVLPIFRLNALDTFTFSNNSETLRAVRLAENIMERVLSSTSSDEFPREFTSLSGSDLKSSELKTAASFEYKVNIRPSALHRGKLNHVGVSVRWGGFFKSYFALHCLKSIPARERN